MAYTKQRIAQAKADGLCLRCCRRPPAAPWKMCSQCRANNTKVLRNLRAEAIEFGMCSICRARPAAAGRRCCEYCSSWRFRRKRNLEWLNER